VPADWAAGDAAEWQRIRTHYLADDGVLSSEVWAISHAGEGDDGKALEDLLDELLGALDRGEPSRLDRFGGTRGVKDRLAGFLGSPYDLVRGVSAVALGVLGDPHAIPLVEHVLDAPIEPPPPGAMTIPSTSHGRAALALGLLGAADQAERLADMIGRSDGFDALGAAVGLGHLRAKRYAKTLAGVMKRTPSEHLQQAALGALLEMDATEREDDVAAVVFQQDTGSEAREAGLFVLAAFKAVKEAPRIAELLRGGWSQGAAAQTLAAMGARQYGGEIAALAADREPTVRHAAALALGVLGDPRYSDALARLLDDEADYIRYAAAFSLVLLDAQQHAPRMLAIIDDFHARGYGLSRADLPPLDAAAYRDLQERFHRGVDAMRSAAPDAGPAGQR
jgi:hypothetical protein